ncbi:MAG: LysM peptidoglycan-binding domain-containing protein [Sulfurimicrobium sp.]|nr:LysM peptidoglycan-binding domain-containing protein [Sulfurimicrobium sp.]MDP2199811.1 LysM peptidoglycan-binding domain-containing protein [Sulfurimicrobium sp.]MDP3687827.1 LysM peptidoglycan-binding domain-containing protein [Sulfurimicrobium sp.]
MRSRAVFFLLCLIIGASQSSIAVAEDNYAAFTSGFTFTQNEPEKQDKQEEPSKLNKPDEQRSTSLEPAERQLSLRPAEKISSDILPLKLESLKNDPKDLWERIRSGFQLAELNSTLVQEHEAWYANRPDYVQRTMERSQRYLFHIVEEVEKRGMPTEIALLPIIESAYNPKAYSTSHASGIWQFIPSTGKHFGLDQNLLYDGRRDILAATDAALDYLQKLYNMFGNWELALAAYNWGEGSVGRAIAKNQANGEPTDYLSLRMPPETRNYVPKLIAVKNIVMNPAAYGLALNSIPNSPYFASVKLEQHMDVAVAARLAEVPLDEFVALNPAYNKPLVAGIGKPTLLLPVDKVNSFSLNLENNERPLSSWQTYTPRRGETLASIAKRFDISLARLKEINAISGRNKHVAAQTLLVPVTKSGNAPTLLAHIPQPEPATGRNVTHIVARGDTILNIAKRYGMSAAELKSHNGLKSNNLARGQKLTILTSNKQHMEKTKVARNQPEAAKALKVAKNSAAKGKHTRYVVKRGDTVFSIARRFDVAVNDLQRWNNIPASNNLRPGNILRVYDRES